MGYDGGMAEARTRRRGLGPAVQCGDELPTEFKLPVFFYDDQTGQFVVRAVFGSRRSDSPNRHQRRQKTEQKMSRSREFVVSSARLAGSNP